MCHYVHAFDNISIIQNEIMDVHENEIIHLNPYLILIWSKKPEKLDVINKIYSIRG